MVVLPKCGSTRVLAAVYMKGVSLSYDRICTTFSLPTPAMDSMCLEVSCSQ